MLDADIPQEIRKDSAAVAIRGFENKNIEAQVLQRVRGVLACGPCPHDDYVVVGGRKLRIGGRSETKHQKQNG